MPTKDSVDILGVRYEIRYISHKKDKRLRECNGYCDWSTKSIVVEKTKPASDTLNDLKYFDRKVLRHEIVHAFFAESGLRENALHYDGRWPNNEEMVDWMAMQGPKIYKAWEEAEAL